MLALRARAPRIRSICAAIAPTTSSDEVVAYLDRAALEGRSPVFVIHGHGTGALRKIVREYMLRSPYVRRWARATRGRAATASP